ncbi:MAG: DUF2207 domain-containing protein [Spirochaetales bacterium]|nr:DUF2207 domain-containing protein [Spirochaetales bacterium]
MKSLDIILNIIFIIVPFIIWYYKGIDKDVFPSIETAPPEGLLPSEVGYILKGRVENNALGVLIISWARRGYIRINEAEDYRLEKIKDLPYSARKYEIYLFDRMFNKYGDGSLFNWTGMKPFSLSRIRLTKRKIVKYFTTEIEEKIFSADTRLFSLVVAFIATLPAAKLIFIELYVLRNDFRHGTGITIGICAFTLISLYIISALLAKPNQLRSSGSWKFILTIFILVVALGTMLTAFFIIGGGSSGIRYVLAMITSFIIIIVLNMMSTRTTHGYHMYEHLLSMKNYFLNADPDSVKKAVKETPDLFLSLLPFAAAMGVSENWAEYFNSEMIDVPSWYITNKAERMNPTELNSGLLGLLKKIE